MSLGIFYFEKELNDFIFNFGIDRIENSEERLVNWIQGKKIEVTQNALRVIEKVRNVESEFHNQLDDFKNNRLAALRSAPVELKDTNLKLLEFVNETLQEIER